MSDVPSDLGPSGSDLWVSVTESYDLDPWDKPVLHNACRLADIADRCAEQLAHEGMSVPGRNGEPVQNPAAVEMRLASAASGKMIRDLKLPDLDEAAVEQPEYRGLNGQKLVPGGAAWKREHERRKKLRLA